MAKWPFALLDRRNWPLLRRGDVAGIIFAVLLIAAALFLLVRFPQSVPGHNYGFGPEWDCTNPGSAGGVSCVKRASDSSASK